MAGMLAFISCKGMNELDEDLECRLTFDCGSFSTRAMDPDEEKISDVSILIFDEKGNAEECLWLKNGNEGTVVNLVKGKTYDIRACANFGYQVYADHIDELEDIIYYMAYPDEYKEGIPMYAAIDKLKLTEDAEVRLEFIRLMAKISVRMDRRKLSDSVEVLVRGVHIGNCPKSVKVFGRNSVTSPDRVFSSGFYRNEFETEQLNTTQNDGRSGEVTLYMLENMQGEMEPHIDSHSQKVFDADDPRREICSYIEMELDYVSDVSYSIEPLIYRFYLGDDLNNLDVERNCHYRITVCPEDDGLSGDGWRVDKSGIRSKGPVSFNAYPSPYIRGDIGDKVHIWCEFTPEDTPFDIGLEYMEDDRKTGIYDYEIDHDGHGAVLTLTGPGRGLIYMEAGEPVNDGVLYIIEVNLPRD